MTYLFANIQFLGNPDRLKMWLVDAPNPVKARLDLQELFLAKGVVIADIEGVIEVDADGKPVSIPQPPTVGRPTED